MNSVAVIVPTRDRPELLRQTLQSIREVEHDGIVETIVVFDNQTPDATLADADSRRPVRVVSNGRVPGLAGARNTGLLVAERDWVAFCDDDDTWMPAKLVEQFAALERTSGSRFATCGVAVEFDGEQHVRIPEGHRLTPAGFVRDRMTEVHPSSFLAERSWLLDEVGLVDEALPGSYAEDYDYLLRVAGRTRIAVAPAPLVRVLWHRSTYFRDRWSMIDRALEHLVEKHPGFADDRRGLARVRGQQAFARAAAGDRRGALRSAGATVQTWPLEPRVPLALLVAAGVPPQRVLESLHRFGRGL